MVCSLYVLCSLYPLSCINSHVQGQTQGTGPSTSQTQTLLWLHSHLFMIKTFHRMKTLKGCDRRRLCGVMRQLKKVSASVAQRKSLLRRLECQHLAHELGVFVICRRCFGRVHIWICGHMSFRCVCEKLPLISLSCFNFLYSHKTIYPAYNYNSVHLLNIY